MHMLLCTLFGAIRRFHLLLVYLGTMPQLVSGFTQKNFEEKISVSKPGKNNPLRLQSEGEVLNLMVTKHKIRPAHNEIM